MDLCWSPHLDEVLTFSDLLNIRLPRESQYGKKWSFAILPGSHRYLSYVQKIQNSNGIHGRTLTIRVSTHSWCTKKYFLHNLIQIHKIIFIFESRNFPEFIFQPNTQKPAVIATKINHIVKLLYTRCGCAFRKFPVINQWPRYPKIWKYRIRIPGTADRVVKQSAHAEKSQNQTLTP